MDDVTPVIRRPLERETWNRWRDYADQLEAEVERLRATLNEIADWGVDDPTNAADRARMALGHE